MSDAHEIAYRREKLARLEAEKLLENLSRELYAKNKALEEANQNLTRNQQTQVQHEKMASVGFLAAGIAHEINNPLGYSLSNLGVMTEYIEELSNLLSTIMSAESLEQVHGLLSQKHFQDIFKDIPALAAESSEGLHTVRKIVKDLQGFARSGNSVQEQVNLNELVGSTLNVLKGNLKYQYVVHTALEDLPVVLCQPAKLNQVFANIIINATSAMPDGGEIYVSTRLDGNVLEVAISDNGPGIPDALKADIFSPFFTTKPVGQGTGLGLSICYAIVTEEHGGQLLVNNEGRGTGANFILRLPAGD
ncbi:MAG: two-component system NtrC family sensor kinase [Candidatus Azotimanducaceae bacterium]|jgi:two-component system NtrC family sensor kinase